jgi:hypothetical protein
MHRLVQPPLRRGFSCIMRASFINSKSRYGLPEQLNSINGFLQSTIRLWTPEARIKTWQYMQSACEAASRYTGWPNAKHGPR